MALAQRARHPFWSRNRDEAVEDDRPVRDDRAAVTPVATRPTVISQVIWLIAGIILLLLGFRFVLSLLGANTTNSFAHFIYTTSHPFVTPFFGLFHYNNFNYGVSRFEVYTLVAMAVYAAVAWILGYLTNIGRRY
jgi:uncharacterized protein YggT (Ycf19 family)